MFIKRILNAAIFAKPKCEALNVVQYNVKNVKINLNWCLIAD